MIINFKVVDVEFTKEQLEALLYRLESISSDEELYYDSIPENLQCSERAETSEEANVQKNFPCVASDNEL